MRGAMIVCAARTGIGLFAGALTGQDRPLRCLSAGVAAADLDDAVMGNVPQARQALEKSGRSLDGVDLIKANGAFAAQSVAAGKALDGDADNVNVDSGAIALAILPARWPAKSVGVVL